MTWASCLVVERSRAWLPFVIILALAPLIVFKYTDFFLSIVQSATGKEFDRLGLTLPLGISFVTFTIISLLIDTARRSDSGPPNFLQTAVYITFFPHLIAGPILRARQIMPQLENIRLDWAALAPNLILFSIGMMKKVLIADPVGNYVDQIYGTGMMVSGQEAILAIIGFSIQIYCDFSAYSDMAIALAGMLGVQFPENFRSPYLSGSMTEVWRRWHMTLSFWLRDYIFKPLHSKFHNHAKYLAIVLTMLISGLWHGANWTFIAWGFLHGLILAIESAAGYIRYADQQKGITRALCIGMTFLIWSLALVIFRASSLDSAIAIFSSAIGLNGWSGWPPETTLLLLLISLTLAFHPLDQIEWIREKGKILPATLIVPISAVIIMSCAMLATGRPQNFYYFDF